MSPGLSPVYRERQRHWSRWLYRIQWMLLALIFLSALALRLNLLHFLAAFDVFKAAGLAVLGMALLSMLVFLWGMVKRHGEARNAALWAMVLGLLPMAVPLLTVGQDNFQRPPIHDITTDFRDPPQLLAAIALRSDRDHRPEYGGEEVARLQRGEPAYRDIQPLQLAGMTVPAATALAAEVGEGLGWRIVTRSPNRGRVEAVARTPILGFTSDVAVRIRAEGEGARVDVRSASRVGVGDMGENARRIRRFLGGMRERAGVAH
ncbi:DUF1499 domain-containing protein [uncultured Microbulbifer sp.]|uniref:DUF1499 domain-containing protein n=1 Tax=uncultured Microbulbifer sp. TaxID=348147 RepID=UPI0025FA43CA|nr:DUF1499 domain-containing protein [uncultured Microbulbifer sp.]